MKDDEKSLDEPLMIDIEFPVELEVGPLLTLSPVKPDKSPSLK